MAVIPAVVRGRVLRVSVIVSVQGGEMFGPRFLYFRRVIDGAVVLKRGRRPVIAELVGIVAVPSGVSQVVLVPAKVGSVVVLSVVMSITIYVRITCNGMVLFIYNTYFTHISIVIFSYKKIKLSFESVQSNFKNIKAISYYLGGNKISIEHFEQHKSIS